MFHDIVWVHKQNNPVRGGFANELSKRIAPRPSTLIHDEANLLKYPNFENNKQDT